MKLRSFRVRIALLSVFLAGSTLIGFGLASWFLIYKTKLARLDSEIKSQLLRESVHPPYPIIHWLAYEKALPLFFGVDSQSQILLLVIDSHEEILHQSFHWPSELDVANLFPPASKSIPPFFLPKAISPPPPFGHGKKPHEAIPHPPFRDGGHKPHEGRPHPPFHDGNKPPEEMQPPDEKQEFPPPEIGPDLPPEDSPRDHELPTSFVTKKTHTGRWRIGAVASPFVRLAIAVSLHTIEREMNAIANIFLISIPVALILVAFGAWLLSGRALKPLHQVTITIQQVTAKGLDQRVAIGDVDLEFVELLQVFNQMMERLDRSFKQASRFSADAAHELKTPLAILQGQLEWTLQRVETGSKIQQTLSDLLDEVRRLGTIIRKLLLLSLADAGQMRLQLVTVNLSEVLADLVEDLDILAPDLEVKTKIPPQLKIKGDRDLLRQVLQNLINNAIKYNIPKGWMEIQANTNGKIVSVTVTNSSLDIPQSDRERIFDRFYRGDRSHNRQIEGLGLGLSLSREIARSHGGELTLDKTPSRQTAFSLTLPIRKTG
jgi:two-component system, OmpR family, heavy metal sensor histidine kinase CusS